MKTFPQIQNEMKRGDFVRVSELAGCSSKTVELIVKTLRPDNFNIQKIFSEYLAQRTEMQRKAKKLKVAA